MKKTVLMNLILFSSLLANNVYLNEDEKKFIKQLKNPYPIAHRFDRTYKFIQNAQSYDKELKLLKTNYFINRILPKYDSKHEDEWLNLKEFLITGAGDCEDYAISKYQLLQELGIKKSNLFLSVVKVKGAENFHMVTLYKDIDGLYTLDNLSWKVIPISERNDLDVEFVFNENESYIINDFGELKKENINRGEIIKLRETLSR
ncbi:MAG TPA: hypothetical protein ENK66_00780 [Arcobacter sp.]|jgi:predicted transglutaminase-like cysteine proteinase|nr:hypothetical protein [Arcobacter sp.]